MDLGGKVLQRMEPGELVKNDEMRDMDEAQICVNSVSIGNLV